MKRAVVVGLDYHAKFLADLVNEHSRTWRFTFFDSSRGGTVLALFALKTADALISFGGPSPNSALTESARRRNLPVFIIWAGSDVIKAQDDPFELEVTKQEGFINLAVAPWLVEELRDLGIPAEYVPVAGMQAGAPPKPIPADFSVLTYLPQPRRDFYGAKLVYEVARSMADVKFEVVGAGGRSLDAPGNVTFHGLVGNMQDRVDACTVLLRQPEHDGTSMLVLEALTRARHVIWNYEFPFVRTAEGVAQVLDALRELQGLHAAGVLVDNRDGRDFVLSTFSRAKIANAIEERMNRGVSEWQARPRRAIRRVAISGLGLFCAEVAALVKTIAPQWEPNVMRTNSRLDVLTAVYTLVRSDVWYSIGSPITDRWVHRVARLLRKPHVVHWVGSDIATLAEQPPMRAALRDSTTTHLAEVEWTAAQLLEQGFQARIAPLPPRHNNGAVRALPPNFTVMLYVPRTRADFYGRQSFKELMRRLSDKPLRYIIVGGGDIDVPRGVLAENLGWRDNLDAVYERTTVLIRNTPRDGLSLMVLEALSYGRHVLWTQDFPYTYEIHSYSDMEREIRALYSMHERGELREQTKASEMVRTLYAPEACTLRIVQAWSDALELDTRSALAVGLP